MTERELLQAFINHHYQKYMSLSDLDKMNKFHMEAEIDVFLALHRKGIHHRLEPLNIIDDRTPEQKRRERDDWERISKNIH